MALKDSHIQSFAAAGSVTCYIKCNVLIKQASDSDEVSKGL